MKDKCKQCAWSKHRGGCLFCDLLHYWPNEDLIDIMGCADFVEEAENLLDFNGKEGRYIHGSWEK